MKTAFEKVNRVEFQCPKCGEKDHLKWWPDDPQSPPPMVNCWNCGNGRGKELQQMVMESSGMVQVAEPPLVTH